MNDRDVVIAFVSHLRNHGYPGLRVERIPDEENGEPPLDAIAGPFAIEHTSIDTLPNQRLYSDWFMRAAGKLEDEPDITPPCRLSITLAYDAVRKGQNWSTVRAALKRWVIDEAPRLPEGKSVIENLPDIPFRLRVVKSSDHAPGVRFARFSPNDATLPARIKESFDEQAAKLAKYQPCGYTTVLLVESYDIALMNNWKMLDAIRTAYPAGPPHGIDQVWFADTSNARALEFREFTPELR